MNGAPGSKAVRQMVEPPEEREASVKARGGKHVKMPPASRSQKPIYVRPIQGNVRYLVGGTQVSTKCRFRGLGDRQQRTPREIYSGGLKDKTLANEAFHSLKTGTLLA